MLDLNALPGRRRLYRPCREHFLELFIVLCSADDLDGRWLYGGPDRVLSHIQYIRLETILRYGDTLNY